MINVTIDHKTFRLSYVQVVSTTDVTIKGEKNTYLDFHYIENGKDHFARHKATLINNEYKIDEDAPVKWYAEQ